MAAAYRRRGDCYSALGRYEQAIADYSKLLQLDPGGNTLARAKAYLALGRYAQAIADLDAFFVFERANRASPEPSPEQIEAYVLRGFSHNKLGDYQQAISDFSTAIETTHTWVRGYKKIKVSSYLNRAFAYMKLEKYEQAAADLEKAMRFDQAADFDVYGEPREDALPTSEPSSGRQFDKPTLLEWNSHRSDTALPVPSKEEVERWIEEYRV